MRVIGCSIKRIYNPFPWRCFVVLALSFGDPSGSFFADKTVLAMAQLLAPVPL
jgi:hypothetical protein